MESCTLPRPSVPHADVSDHSFWISLKYKVDANLFAIPLGIYSLTPFSFAPPH